jgi:hypothetical protein
MNQKQHPSGLLPTQADTVRVHGFTAVDGRQIKSELVQVQQESWQAYRQLSAEIQDRYFEGTIREAQAGAQLVLWTESP